MALADRVLLLGAALAVTVPGCTVFNGKALPADAGAPASGDGAAASSAACACPASARVCETFDTAPSAIWSSLGDAPPTTDPGRAHCGTASLRLHTDAVAAGQDAVNGLVDTQTLATLTAGFYARAWVYVPKQSSIGAGNTISLLEIQQSAEPFLGIATQITDSTLALSDWAATPNEYHPTGSPIVRDQWTCLEWQVAVDPTNGASQLWVDGTATSAGFSGKTTSASPPFSRFLVALFFSGVPTAQPAFDMWIDDLVIGPSRIGCDG